MPMPKSVVKMNKKDGVTFASNVDKANYTIHELTRAALRDVGKFVRREFKQRYYSHFKRKTGNVGKGVQYFVKSKTPKPILQVGLKAGRYPWFYGRFQEIGTSKQPKLGLISKSVKENIAKIIEIESRYLSAIEDEAKALQLIDEDKEGLDE
jgi:HK97 gp10 family phage protein